MGAALDAPLTFMFTDIEASTRLLASLGDKYADVLLEHRRLIRDVFARYDGLEVSTEGDSFFAVFPTSTAAIAAGAAIQVAIATHDWNGAAVHVRIGIHSGHAARVADSFVGLDVHRAARIMAAGYGDQTVVSDATRVAARDRLPDNLSLRDLGRHRLKDIGPERLWQLEGPGLSRGPFGALRTLERHPSNLPPETTIIVGRETDAIALGELVRRSPVATVTGPGGIGKSRLAIHVAHTLLGSFPDGAFYLDVAAIDTRDTAVDRLCAVLGIGVAPDVDQLQALVDEIRGRDLLIVLDTVDRIVGAAELVAKIAGSCPRVRFLVTARSPLHLAGEREYPLSTLGDAAAVELFVQRARAIRPDFVVDQTAAKILRDICRRLDGLPLAIELAASRIRVFSPAVLLERLSTRLPLLRGGPNDLPDRQRTLYDTIAWSYALLGPPEQAVFERLAVFAQSFDLPAVEAVGTPPGASPDDTLAVFEQLADRSLVAIDGEAKFKLLGTIAEFALEALRRGDDHHSSEGHARDAHARYWLGVARTHLPELQGPHDLDAVAVVADAAAEFRTALEHLLAASGPFASPERAELGLELAGTLGRFWWVRGQVREGSEWLERAIALTPAGVSGPRATALFWAGVLLDDLREPQRAADRIETSLRLERELANDEGVARALNSLGVVARSLGDLDRAEKLLRESLERKRGAGDESGAAATLSNLGVVAYDRGDLNAAIALLEEARGIDLATGSRGSIVSSTLNLASLLVEAGRTNEGVDAVRAAVSDLAELADPELCIGALETLASAALANPAPRWPNRSDAAPLFLTAVALRERYGIAPRSAEQETSRSLREQVAAATPAEALARARTNTAGSDTMAAVAILTASLGLPVPGVTLHDPGEA
jgi:predicted ATPase/class 3 adenylate cyclase